MVRSRIPSFFSRGAVCGVLALSAAVWAPSAAAQGYCPVWTDVLLDTSDSCVSSPSRDRAFDVDTLTWSGGDFLILNRGNELELFNITGDPTHPDRVDLSKFKFGTRGDSDYDLMDFDVCDGCRFGVMSRQTKRTVIFDMGTAGTPTFPSYQWKTYEWVTDRNLGGVVFKKGTQQYLIAAELTDDCGSYSALYALNGVDDLNFLECVEADGNPLHVRKGETLHAGGSDYGYFAEPDGQIYVFELVGSGAALTLDYTDTPTGFRYRFDGLSIDSNNLIAASAYHLDDTVTFWDLSDPAHPFQIPGWTLSGREVRQVTLRSPSPGSPAVLWTANTADQYTTRTYLVSPDSGPQIFDTEYWTDPALPHNDFNCHLPMAAAMAPDGSALYLSRYTVHEVFDLSACLGPVEAIADVTVSPTMVFPGDEVTVADVSMGTYDQWALWVTEGASPDGQVVGGYPPPPEPDNPHFFVYAVPQDVAYGQDFYAHVQVDNVDPPPDVVFDSQMIGIDRAPDASFTITPAAPIQGDTITLTATAEGTPVTYKWTITDPSGTPSTLWGATKSVTLDASGDWTFVLSVEYLHTIVGGGQYVATATANLSVTSVAADFSITPAAPLDTQVITLDGSISNWAPGASLLWDWQIAPAPPGGWTCPATEVCTIPESTLLPDTTYTITLTLTNTLPDPDDVSVASDTVRVGNGAIQPDFTWSPSTPEIGESVSFRIQGLPDGVELDKAVWNFDNNGCDGGGASRTCIPTIWDDCKGYSFKFSSGGTKDVTLSVQIDGNTFPVDGPVEKSVFVASTGDCGGGGGECTYTISPTSRHFGPAGGTSSVTVNTQSSCAWTVSGFASWVTITNGTVHTGDGKVYYKVAPNDGRSRADGMRIAGRTFLVTQDAPWVAADFGMSPIFPDIGETVSFSVNPILEIASWNFGEPDCYGNVGFIDCQGVGIPAGFCNEIEWTFTTPGEKSITMVLEDGRSQTKGPTVGTTGECCYLDGRPDASFTMSTDKAFTGEPVFFTDTSSKALAEVKATLAVDFSWLPLDPEIGQGVLFKIGGLTDDVQKATWDFGDAACDGGGAVRECVPDLWNNCTAYTFTYSSDGPKTVTLTVETASGTFSAGPHTATVASTGTCEDDGGGDGCSYVLSPLSADFPAVGGTGSFSVNTTAECAWSATESYDWLTISPVSGVGPGTVGYTVAENLGSSRTGYIRAEGRSHRVNQDKVPGNTAPTEWLWTITLDGELVTSSSHQHFSYAFKEPGVYIVELDASNCAGSDSRTRSLEVQQAVVNDFFVGAAVKLKGVNDTSWESDFRFHNPCGESLDVRIEYQPEGSNNSGGGLKYREFTLDVDETRVFADIIEAIPDLEDEELTGSVRIESFSDSGCKVLSASRTFNDTPYGTLGLFMPALPVKAVGSQFLDVTGLTHNKNYRANIRLVNFQEEDAWVHLTAVDRAGTPLAARGVWVFGQSALQLNNVLEWVGVGGTLSLFSVRVDTGGADVEALGTVTDNTTGDSVLNLSSFQNENTIWVAGAAHIFGVNDSVWRTDLWMLNPTEDWLAGEVEYVVGDSPQDRYGFEWPLMTAGSVQQNLDIVGDLLGGEESLGYLVLTGKDGGPAPQIAARTYNLDPSGGTYGLGLPVFGSRQLLLPGEIGYIPGVSNSENKDVGFRTNLGLLNTDPDGWSEVRITLYDLDGVEAADPLTMLIAPGVLEQFDIFRRLGLRDVTMAGSVRVEVVGGGAVAAYATETDNRTQDSIFNPAQRAVYGSSR